MYKFKQKDFSKEDRNVCFSRGQDIDDFVAIQGNLCFSFLLFFFVRFILMNTELDLWR